MPVWCKGLKRPLQIGLGAAVLVAIITLFMPNYYRSEARILPVESKSASGLGNLAAAAAAFGVNVPGGDGGNDTNFVDIIKSRWMAEKLLATQFNFKAKTWRFGAQKDHHETLRQFLRVKSPDRAVKRMGQFLSASRDLKTKIISLSAETKSPELSQQIVQKTCELLETFVQQKGRTRGGAKASFAEARLKEAREEALQAETDFQRFLEGNRNYGSSTDPSTRIRGARLEAEMRLRQQLVSTLAISREQALMEEKNDIPILNILDPSNLPSEKNRPSRSNIVIAVFVLVTAGSAAWKHRDWIRARLVEGGDEREI